MDLAAIRAARKIKATQMASYYTAGETLQQIGDRYGITRERVRQLIKQVGLAGKDGGQAAKSRAVAFLRAAKGRERRDERTQPIYGCGYQELIRLNGGLIKSAHGSPAHRYLFQRKNAQIRGIGWEITFPEWIGLWNESGHWSERGQGRSRYCMARFNDEGPYKLGNVYITTCADNVRDYQADLKVRGVVCPDGWTRLPEKSHKADGRPRCLGSRAGSAPGRGWTIHKRSKARPYQVVLGKKYIGCFATQAEAESAYQQARIARYGG